MDLKIAARMIAVLTLGSSLTAAVMVLRGDGPEGTPGDAPTAQSLRDPGGEPAANELARCRDIGPAALEDAACRKAWAENRRRFLETAKPRELPLPKPERFGHAPAASPAQPPAGKADEAARP
jgi:conjugative transfer region protein TrbK